MWSQSGREKPPATEPRGVGEYELSSAWRNPNQGKAALRHINNQSEAAVGSGVVITSLNTEKTHKHKRGGRRSSDGDDAAVKPRPQSRRSPDKSSRSPLRTSTQDNTHTSHRPTSSPPEASLSHLVYDRDCRPLHSADADSTRSSALDATTVRVLNDPPALHRSEVTVGGSEVSPGSARLEKLRQRQTDDKLEKLRERIRRQREQLEDSTDRAGERAVGAGQGNPPHQHIAKVRKVAAAPPAPNYKGFNSSEVKLHSSDSRVWGQDEFHLNPEIYKALTDHLPERAKRKPAEKERQERKLIKPVRKIHRSASVPEPKPAIGTSSWRDGQKLVKMMLGPLPREPRAQSEGRARRTGTASCSSSVPGPDPRHRSRPSSTEKPAASQPSRAAGGARGKEHPPNLSSKPPGGNRERETAVTPSSRPPGGAALPSSLDLLSANIRTILDDLHLEEGAGSRDADRVGRKRAGRSPSKPRPDSAERALPRKRHYDSDTVRRYIAKQQEERKRKQAEERRSQREEQERRSQRLQELYKKQREGVTKQQAPPPNHINPRLQETYTKILLEHTLQQAWPGYQPSGESDKENKRLEPVSPSTSDLSQHTPSPLYRGDLATPPAGQFFSHLLSLDPERVNSTTHTTSRLNRVEALKACAASLSNRIETEARKLITHGDNNDDTDGHACRAKPPSPPERERPDSSSRIHDDASELPGVGNMYGFIVREGWGEIAKPRLLPADSALPFAVQEEKHDSSGGSISEGLLSDGSLSDPGDRINLFRKEAELHVPYRPATSQPPWEELSKGSPHSVINIFARNINKYGHVMDTEVDRSPPALRSSPSTHSSANGVVYEDDFVSSRSQSASKRTTNGISNGRSSSASTPLSSPSSAHSIGKRGSEKSLERTLVDGQRSASSFASEPQRSDWRKSDSPRGSRRSADGNGTPGGASVRSSHSMVSEIRQFPTSPVDSPRIPGSSSASPASARDSTPRAGTAPGSVPNTGPTHNLVSTPGPAHSTTELHFAPVVLQHRLSAELNFLDAVEESVRQLSDVERVRAVSLAQQESVSLAQIIKAQQQRQERELQLLKLKAEQDALEAQRHVQESRERAAQAHAELCENVVQSHQKALMELQENSSKMIHQHAETAQHLREMTEMTRSQMLNVPSVTPVRQPHPQTDSSRSEVSTEKTPTADTPQSSLTESESFRIHTVSVRQGDSDCVDRSSSVEEEVNTAADDSLQTDRDSVSIIYSSKFDESVTEDELEKSFRSVLPSESHWRGSVERKRQSDEEPHPEKSSNKQDGSVPVFSADQYSFSEFTMAMVKQCMQEEEVRSRHQSSLLRLRHRALKEKTRAELDWLELQKRRLRDKGEDDKMPPIRKKQRGLLLKLQQEQAEIRRLQEVNRAARRERKLLLKQQEEIERIQHTTLKLREKLRNAEDTNQRSPVSGVSEDLAPPTELNVEFRSPSPLSVSGSETSSIMKKLKKMSYHTDESGSCPVQCLFSMFSALHWASLRVCLPKLHPHFLLIYSQLVRFLTQRELRLVHWRQQVEAELRRTDGAEPQREGRAHSDQHVQQKRSPDDLQRERQEERKTGREVRSEGDSSPPLSVSSIHTVQECENTHSHESPVVQASSSSKVTSHSSSRKRDLPSSAPTSEAASDQSDIEGRVLALRAELRRRKAEAQRLKKEQRLRHKERLKAQEASLLKQLESCNEFIQKTKAELSEADSAASAKPQIKTPTSGSHKSRTKTSTPDRSETEKSFTGRSQESESDKSDRTHTESPALSDEDPPTVTPTPVLGSPNHLSPPEPQNAGGTQPESSAGPKTDALADGSVASSPRSEIIEELESPGSRLSRSEHSYPALDLKIQDSNEDFSKNETEIALAAKVGHEEKEIANNSEDIRSNSSSLVAKPEPEEPKRPEIPSPVDVSYTPDVSPRKENDEDSEHKPTASPSLDSYNDDFESAVQEENRSRSPSSEDLEEGSYKFSFSSSEEEIEEEISVKSGNTSGTVEQERPLELDFLGKRTEERVDSNVPSPPKSPEDEMPGYVVGDRVLVSNVQPGTLRFKGRTSFASGLWTGVELDASEGSNDGSYDGVVYFQCKEKHGIFAPPEKISRLPEASEGRTRTSEKEDSSFEDRSNETEKTNKSESTLQNKKADPDPPSETREPSEKHSGLDSKLSGVTKDLKIDPAAIDGEIFENLNGGTCPVSLERFGDVVLDVSKVEDVREDQTPDILDLLIRSEMSTSTEDLPKSLDVPPERTSEERMDGSAVTESKSLTTLADTLVERFMSDALKQFQQIKKAKEEKISAANQHVFLAEDEEPSGSDVSQLRTSSSSKIDKESFHNFFDKDQEEVSSPELCNRSESPVLGQEELVQRLAELELNREFLHVLGDEQDWFDEDFGLSSRRHAQHKNKPRQDELTSMSAAKLPHVRQQQEEAAAMLVPHKAAEVEKLVSAALLEIWRSCGMERGNQSLTAVPKPQASETLLGDENGEQCVRSYKQAVFDLAWELMQEIYAEDPNADRPPWIKPFRVNSPYIHRIDDPSDLTQVQALVSGEVLKLFALNKEQNHRTDWQKMLKFGRKKRDRVDHILVQELHEEEALWVNYDEDELFVKMQLADGILDTLLKDTVDLLTNIHERRRSTRALS
ncbi:centrosome-associated protein 350 isoform X3 [Ictalurus punctatus]|uniref:Centrosome-associated protein 350 isoform X3 n=1 Tax=Ictalurus punctatus TaxID=7998 RepID=A0A979EV42_ICTPU|nr:centrosome-associated protein 350 isoform X3 [Ictalurus punctatus]